MATMVSPCWAKPVGRDSSPGGDAGPVHAAPSVLTQLLKPKHSTLHAEPRASSPLVVEPTTFVVASLNGPVGAAAQVVPSLEVNAPPNWAASASGELPTATKPPLTAATSRRLTPASAAAVLTSVHAEGPPAAVPTAAEPAVADPPGPVEHAASRSARSTALMPRGSALRFRIVSLDMGAACGFIELARRIKRSAARRTRGPSDGCELARYYLCDPPSNVRRGAWWFGGATEREFADCNSVLACCTLGGSGAGNVEVPEPTRWASPAVARRRGGVRVLSQFGSVRLRFRLLASLTGYAITAFMAWWVLTRHTGWAGRDVDLWLRVGAQVRDGISPYGDTGLGTSFYYAPPWALLMGATTWIGKPLFWLMTALLEIAALRYIAGSWLRVGYFGLFFLTGAEIVSGAFNLVLAAGLAAAVRGDSRLAAFTALAKLSPALAIREWRGPAVVLAVVALATLPVLGWWGDWLTALAGAPTAQATLGYYQLPLAARLLVAAAILGLWRSP